MISVECSHLCEDHELSQSHSVRSVHCESLGISQEKIGYQYFIFFQLVQGMASEIFCRWKNKIEVC